MKIKKIIFVLIIILVWKGYSYSQNEHSDSASYSKLEQMINLKKVVTFNKDIIYVLPGRHLCRNEKDYILQTYNCKIYVYNNLGKIIREISPEEFGYPKWDNLDVKFSLSNSHLYIYNSYSNEIYRYDSNYKFQKKWDCSSDLNLYSSLHDIICINENKILLGTREKYNEKELPHFLFLADSNLNIYKEFCTITPNIVKNNFYPNLSVYPKIIVNNDKIYVSLFIEHSIQVFDLDGNFIKNIDLIPPQYEQTKFESEMERNWYRENCPHSYVKGLFFIEDYLFVSYSVYSPPKRTKAKDVLVMYSENQTSIQDVSVFGNVLTGAVTPANSNKSYLFLNSTEGNPITSEYDHFEFTGSTDVYRIDLDSNFYNTISELKTK